MEIEISAPHSKGIPCGLSLVDQVALDLNLFCDKFPSKSFAVRTLAKETGLNEKTIKRLLAKENKPTYQTIYKLYAIFLEESEHHSLLKKCPEVVRTYIEDYSPAELEANTEKDEELLALIRKEPLVAEIFVLAGTGPLHEGAVGFRYGQYGLEVVARLEEAGILIKAGKGVYTLSSKAPNLDASALKYLGEYFVHRFSKPQEVMSENTISFYAEGLNDEGLKAWLAVDTEAFYKKLKIAADAKYKGTRPVFTFTATDTIVRTMK